MPAYIRLSPAAFKALLRKRAEKKEKRVAKSKALGIWRPKRGDIKEDIVHLLGLLDRKEHGPLCRLGSECPRWKRIGPHNGEVAYHLIPQKRGDAARFLRKNVVWACRDANEGERHNRDLYREKHVRIFGRDVVESIEVISRTTADFSTADLLEIRRQVREWLGHLTK